MRPRVTALILLALSAAAAMPFLGCGDESGFRPNEDPGVTVSVTPDTAVIGAGQHLSLVAVVNGLDGAQVNWSVNGVAGGNSTVGTIDSQSLYTAPPPIVGEMTVTVTAACAEHPTAYADATVTVIEPVDIEMEDYASYIDLGGEAIYKQSCGAASGGWAVEGFTIVGETLFFNVSLEHGGYYAGVLTAAAVKDVKNEITVTILGAGPSGEDQQAVFEIVGKGIT